MSTLIIVNPHAGNGRAGRLWSRIEPLLWEALGDLVIAVTQRPEEVAKRLRESIDMGLKRVITVGGDGTNHVIINALADLAERQPGLPLPVLGSLPIGTGRDWARTVGVPFDPEDAVRWLAMAQPRPVDLGHLAHSKGAFHFLNIASAGIGGEVDARVNAIRRRRSWTFLVQTVGALLRYRPRFVRVMLNGETWYEGTAFIVVVANGRSFGHGMYVAPDAQIDDGLFDVVVVEGMSPLEAIPALPSLYKGTHLLRSDVHHTRAADVRIESPRGPLDLDLDGEYSLAEDLHFTVRPGLLQILSHPTAEET